MTVIIFNITLLLLLLFLSAFFSASETALFSISRIERRRLETAHPYAGRIVTSFLDSPQRILTTILIGNMFVNVTAAAVATNFLMRTFGKSGLGIAVCAMTFLILIFGEVMPKIFAIRNAKRFSFFTAGILKIFDRIISPVRWGIRLITDRILFLFLHKKTFEPFFTRSELSTLVSISEEEGVIEEDEEEMIQAVFEFGSRDVSEIMTPRVDIIGCNIGSEYKEVRNIIRDSKHTKIPVFKESIDRIEGLISVKDFIMLPSDRDWRDFIKPVLFIPEAKKLDDVLLEFQSKKSYTAIVVDEYGGTAGLVTLEDVLEEIVGDIRDEFDVEESFIKKLDKDTYQVSGDISLRDINEQMELKLHMEDVETIGGFLLALFERIPSEGEVAEHNGLRFSVDEIDARRIKKITIFRF